MNDSVAQSQTFAAVDVLAVSGNSLREHFRFPWTHTVQQSINRLRWASGTPNQPSLVALVGGASSGKSTVFNNLLDGHLVSYITARGHATRGPIMAVHERHRDEVDRCQTESFLPKFERVSIDLDGNCLGEPNQLSIVYHTVNELRDVLLFDTPDFTSEAALRKGDVTLNLLPWFDALVIVLDPERWFDRQSVSQLRDASVRYGQRRFVLFNRTQEGEMAETDAAQLRVQADRLSTDCSSILEFRRGRGFCRFPPGTLREVQIFLNAGSNDRTTRLLQVVADAADEVLNQNEERHARALELKRHLATVVERVTPSDRDCMLALMTPDERRQIEIVWRVLRATDTREWINAQAQRLQKMVSQVPVIGSILSPSRVDPPAGPPPTDRMSIARSFHASVIDRIQNESLRAVRGSKFSREIEAWTGLTPPEVKHASIVDPAGIDRAAKRFGNALAEWNARVENECRGLAPSVGAGVGAGMVAVAVILVAAPGPITALTLVAAKGAIAATLAHLAAASGAAALFGRQIGRFVEVVREKAIGSPEFSAVQDAARGVRAALAAAGREIVASASTAAEALVLPESSEEFLALRRMREAGES